MPLLARWYVKTALLYAGAALLVGIAIALGPLLDYPATAAALWTTYLHLFVLGWLTQLIFGVALWLFPRYSKELPHGRTALAWAAYVLLNAGLLLRAVAEPGVFWSGRGFWAWALVASAILQWLSVSVFVLYIWRRVRTK